MKVLANNIAFHKVILFVGSAKGEKNHEESVCITVDAVAHVWDSVLWSRF